jgi:hypothetical protein
MRELFVMPVRRNVPSRAREGTLVLEPAQRSGNKQKEGHSDEKAERRGEEAQAAEDEPANVRKSFAHCSMIRPATALFMQLRPTLYALRCFECEQSARLVEEKKNAGISACIFRVWGD